MCLNPLLEAQRPARPCFRRAPVPQPQPSVTKTHLPGQYGKLGLTTQMREPFEWQSSFSSTKPSPRVPGLKGFELQSKTHLRPPDLKRTSRALTPPWASSRAPRLNSSMPDCHSLFRPKQKHSSSKERREVSTRESRENGSDAAFQ